MRIYWSALLGYGFVFWIMLCIADFLGVTNVHKYSRDFDDLYDKPIVIQEIKKQLEPHLNKLEYRGVKFGWSLLVWNIFTFVFSIVICSIGRSIAWICWELYRSYKNGMVCSHSTSQNQHMKSLGSSSRIPVIVNPTSRFSDTNLPSINARSKIDTDKSCPNLLLKRSGSNLSTLTDITTKTCRTIFRKDVFLTDNPSLSNEEQLEKQCRKLKEELHRLQTTSLKEHAILSRKLDSINKDKKEISKQLTVAQKENRAAKQQLEETLQEKASLLKKLESAAKEFKSNTKTKKFALAKLEEVTNNVEELRQQLEQVSRDKEILEKKLKLLEIEYNKLHERYIESQQKIFTNYSVNENLPERDDNSENCKRNYLERCNLEKLDNGNLPPVVQQTADVLASVSQTELDMRKIQEKIKQLEQSLENLNVHNEDFGCNGSLNHLESELSLSTLENTTDSQIRIDDDESGTALSEFSSNNSPRQTYWSDKVVELIRRNKHHFSKIQALTTKVQEKARFLGNIGEKSESTDSDDAEPKRLVSSSVAFKNFLKGLSKLDAAKKGLSSHQEVYF